MAETLEIGEISERPPEARLVSPPRPPRQVASVGVAFKSLAGSLSAALAARRLFVLIPFAMIGGLVASIELPADAPPWVLAGGFVAIAVTLVLSLRWVTAVRALTLLAAGWIGLCLLPVHGALEGTAMLARPAYGTYQAHVDAVLNATPGAQRVVLSAIEPDSKTRQLPVRRARAVLKGGATLHPGDLISGRFRFAPVPGPAYPGGFDTQFHSYFDGIGAYGTSIGATSLVSAGDPAGPMRIIDAIRTGIATRIDAVLAEPTAGVARAIINGDESAVTDDVRTTMATAGIAHVLSVSGLHLTIVAGGVFWVLRLLFGGFDALARHLSVKRLAAAGGIVAALFYFGISGGNVAAFRSTLMILLVFGAVLVGRQALTMRNAAIAGIVVIAVDPAGVFRPSFQLSFAAVIALIGAYENLRGQGGRDAGFFGRAWGYAKGIIVTSLVAGVATLVFSVYHFQQTSPLGVVGNLLTLPLVGFIMMPAALIAVLLMPLNLEGLPLVVMGWSVDRMLDMASLVAGWSTHLRAAPLLTPWALVFALGALAWFAFLKDRWRLLGPAVALVLVVLLAVDHRPDVLISDTTQALAIRGTSGLELADGKSQSFALNVWRDTYAEPIDRPAVDSCDSIACIGTSSAGFTWALVDDPAGFADECGRADLVITRDAAPSWCKPKALVDATVLGRTGVQWLRWDAGSGRFEVRSAIDHLDRPWRITP